MLDLKKKDIINEKTGIIMGSGGPSTKTLVESADITREKGPKELVHLQSLKQCHQQTQQP